MTLDIDRIRDLADDPNADLPPITTAQAIATVRLLNAGQLSPETSRATG